MSRCYYYYCRPHRYYYHHHYQRCHYFPPYHRFFYYPHSCYRPRIYRPRLYRRRYMPMYYIRGIGYVSLNRIRAALGAEYYKKRIRKFKRFKTKAFPKTHPFQDTYENKYSSPVPIISADDAGVEDSY